MTAPNHIELVNRSRYQTRDIRRIVRAVMIRFWRVHRVPARVRIVCKMRGKTDGFCGGSAYYNSGRITMKMPRLPVGYAGDDVAARFARTLVHELYHCRGFRHGEMPADHTFDVSYATGMPLRMMTERKPRPKPDAVARLTARRKTWESKLRRCQNALRKIDRQLRYHERRRLASIPSAA